jgi:hypothetical protein
MSSKKKVKAKTKVKARAKGYTQYPSSHVLIYNGTTVLHYLLGGIGIILGYIFSWIGYLIGALYLVFAFVQMYVIMPLTVCPNCVYYRLKNALCTSGLNVLSQKMAKGGTLKDFPNRGKGLFCHNHLYIAALIIPLFAMLPALILNFSFLLLAIFFAVVGLLLFRFFVIFPKIACIHCRAKNACPNAKAMGFSNM